MISDIKCDLPPCPQQKEICCVECDEKCAKRCKTRWGHCEIRKSQLPQPQLKPCPFCGWEAKITKNEDGYAWSIYCDNCYAEMNTGYSHNKNDLIDNWNRRCRNDVR